MKKLLPFLYAGILPLSVLTDYYEVYYCRNFLSAVILYITVVSFLIERKYAKTAVDKAYLTALVIAFIAELCLGLLDSPILKVIINTLGFFFTVNYLIRVFRLEGSVFPMGFAKKDLGTWIFSVLILIIFLLTLPRIPNYLLFSSLLFLVQMTFLYWMATLRPVSFVSSLLVNIGVLVFMVAQFWILLAEYIFANYYPYRTFLYIILYALSFFLINRGLLMNLNKKEN